MRNLRVALKLNQEQFAAKMGVGRIAALYWESGRSQPSAEVYVRMAKVAREIDLESAVWFWEQIGVDRDALNDLLPELKKSYDEAEQRVRVASQESAKGIVNVPILRGIGSAKEPLRCKARANRRVVPITCGTHPESIEGQVASVPQRA